MNKVISQVTAQIEKRSKKNRNIYLQRIDQARIAGVNRQVLSCSNLAHGVASCSMGVKNDLLEDKKPNIAIVTAYNDMLSAHEPFRKYPKIIKKALKKEGATAQVAGGVAAMCDGITQSQPGMQLSLFSRDNIAQSTAIALSHNMFDGALYLGVCDKIVPGLLIGALSFGHLPAVFVPAGPMSSGIDNDTKAKARQDFTKGKIDKKTLLEIESKSYHSPGTCTFYGTANSNQMLMEIMGLHLPGSSFVSSDTKLREALTKESAKRVLKLTSLKKNYQPLGEMLNEKSFVNAIIGLLATGGSSNHTLHLVAMAKAAGIILRWEDFSKLSKVVPLITRMYPNGTADVNHFQAAGGMGVVIRELLSASLLHEDVNTIVGFGLKNYLTEPFLDRKKLKFKECEKKSLDKSVISGVKNPFDKEGGLKVLKGNIGESVIKTSAIKERHRVIKAKAIVFDSQSEVMQSYKKGKLHRDFIAVVRFQGPKANGMPELHSLTPPLGVLQDLGYKVAIVTDGRMSGASGKVPAAIHMTPEAKAGGVIAKIQTGDEILFDITSGRVELLIERQEIEKREAAKMKTDNSHGFGRELFCIMRDKVGAANEGATIFNLPGEERC